MDDSAFMQRLRFAVDRYRVSKLGWYKRLYSLDGSARERHNGYSLRRCRASL